jgi:hypothetical protein
VTRQTSTNTAVRLAGSVRRSGLGILAAAMVAISPGVSLAQAVTPAKPPASSFLVVPTTKLLAIGSWTAKASPGLWQPILPAEARATALLYFDGTIDQWFVKQDHSGVVFLLNVTDPAKAKALLDQLPLGKAGLMEFQLIPLGPLSPLRLLFSPSAK